MKIIQPYLRIYQQILKDLENALPFLNVPKPKAGRKPKLTDTHIAAIYCEVEGKGECLEGEVEMDESYFRAFRERKKRS